jgi:hypothetical protein
MNPWGKTFYQREKITQFFYFYIGFFFHQIPFFTDGKFLGRAGFEPA